MKRAAIYVRVSHEEQKKHGLSVDNQITALQEYCKENKITIAGLYNDAGISARKNYKMRPALLKLIEDCKEGKIDVILFTRLDRWFRNIQGYYEVQAQLDECKVPWRAIWEDYETESSEGIFKVNIMLSVAQAEADRTSEKIKSVFQYKRERGDYIGKAPQGYIKTGGKLIIDEKSKDGMDAFFKTYLNTFSVKKAKAEAEKYGIHIDVSHVYDKLLNPAYYGEAKGGYKCEAYITKEQHEILKKRFASMPRKPRANNSYIFSGLVRCQCCGLRMYGLTQNKVLKKSGKTIIYRSYVCSNYGQKNYAHTFNSKSEEAIETYLLENLEELRKSHVEWIKAQNEAVANNDGMALKKSLEAKLKRIAVLFEEGDIDVDSYKEKRDEIKAQIESIKIDELPEPRPLPENWKEIYSELDREHKAIFWKKVIDKIVVPVGKYAIPEVYFL